MAWASMAHALTPNTAQDYHIATFILPAILLFPSASMWQEPAKGEYPIFNRLRKAKAQKAVDEKY